MSARIPDTHAEAWALLPWLANGRIAPEDREWVEAHLQGCDECRAELATQRLVASHVTSDDTTSRSANTSDEQRSFNKLWARIEAAESAAPADTGTPVGKVVAPRSSRTVRWLAAAVVVQAIGLGVLGVAVNSGNRDAAGSEDDIKTVSTVDPRTSAPAVRLAFAPETPIANINTLLMHQGLSIVSGPGRSGNFTAVLTAEAVATGATADSVASVISKDPNVTFAQPIAR